MRNACSGFPERSVPEAPVVVCGGYGGRFSAWGALQAAGGHCHPSDPGVHGSQSSVREIGQKRPYASRRSWIFSRCVAVTPKGSAGLMDALGIAIPVTDLRRRAA